MKQPEIKMLDVAKLKPYERNPRRHSEQQVDQIARSMAEFGFVNPILVRGLEVVAGHGRLEAAKKLKLKKVPTLAVDHLTLEQAHQYLIADNKLALNAAWDYELLAEELAEMTRNGMDPTVSGFDLAEIDAICNGWKPDFEQPHPTTHDGPLVARIVVTCDPANKVAVMAMLRTAIAQGGIEGVEVAT